jgi:hypothetical protein
MGLCPHGRVRTLCAACRPDPKADYLAGLGPVEPHRWTRETTAGKIRRSELVLIEQASYGGKRPKTLELAERDSYWTEHAKLYPGGSASSAEWKWTRDAILTRDGHACCICRSTETLHIDHIQPLSRGGTNAWTNLWTLCKLCHEAKTGRRLA